MNFGTDLSFAQGIVISLFSIAVVFIVLLLISFVIDIVAALLKKSGKNLPAPSASTAVSRGPVSSSVEEEEVAAVVAAIAMYMGNNDFQVKSVKEEKPGSWGVSARVNSVN